MSSENGGARVCFPLLDDIRDALSGVSAEGAPAPGAVDAAYADALQRLQRAYREVLDPLRKTARAAPETEKPAARLPAADFGPRPVEPAADGVTPRDLSAWTHAALRRGGDRMRFTDAEVAEARETLPRLTRERGLRDLAADTAVVLRGGSPGLPAGARDGTPSETAAAADGPSGSQADGDDVALFGESPSSGPSRQPTPRLALPGLGAPVTLPGQSAPPRQAAEDDRWGSPLTPLSRESSPGRHIEAVDETLYPASDRARAALGAAADVPWSSPVADVGPAEGTRMPALGPVQRAELFRTIAAQTSDPTVGSVWDHIDATYHATRFADLTAEELEHIRREYHEWRTGPAPQAPPVPATPAARRGRRARGAARRARRRAARPAGRPSGVLTLNAPLTGMAAARAFYDRFGHLNVPARAAKNRAEFEIEGVNQYGLYAFLRKFHSGRLPASVSAEDREWLGQKLTASAQTGRLAGYDAARAFYRRHGHLRVPANAAPSMERFQVEGVDLKSLYAYLYNIRRTGFPKKTTAEQRAWLETRMDPPLVDPAAEPSSTDAGTAPRTEAGRPPAAVTYPGGTSAEQDRVAQHLGGSLQDVPGDGDCFMHALRAVLPDVPDAAEMRSELADYLRALVKTGEATDLLTALENQAVQSMLGDEADRDGLTGPARTAWIQQRGRHIHDQGGLSAAQWRTIADTLERSGRYNNVSGDLAPLLAGNLYNVLIRVIADNGTVDEVGSGNPDVPVAHLARVERGAASHWVAVVLPDAAAARTEPVGPTVTLEDAAAVDQQLLAEVRAGSGEDDTVVGQLARQMADHLTRSGLGAGEAVTIVTETFDLADLVIANAVADVLDRRVIFAYGSPAGDFTIDICPPPR